MHKFNLCDPIAQVHGPYQCPTFSRGSKCIDYILVSSSLLSSVSRCGIPPFNSIMSSDHRPIFIDLDPTTLFSHSLSPLVSPPNRRLFSNAPHRREQYVDLLFSSFQHHRIFDRIHRLQLLSNGKDLTPATQLCDSLDRDITRLMVSAEKRLKKPSPTPFSSALAQACIRVSLLKLQYLVLKHQSDKQHSINHLQQRLNTPLVLPTTISDLTSELKKTRKEVRTIRKEAVLHREEFLASLSLSKDIGKIIRHIRKAEEMRRGFTKIRFAIKPTRNSVITHIEVPTDGLPPKQSKQWKRIIDPVEVTTHLLNRNTQHFASAHGSPFTVPPLSTQFDWEITSPHYDHVLQGQTSQYTSKVSSLLQLLHRKVPPTRATLTTAELISRFRKWKETTTTSPSRRHLGHYKSLLPPTKYDLDEYLTTKEGQILEVHRSLLNFCATTGHTLPRWSHIITTMIPKDVNSFKIHRLRVIHIYEADFTALCSIWSKCMLRAASAHLSSGSFGARPGRTSTDPPFILLLQTEIAALSRTSLGIGPNDAAQCYDRMVPNHSLLSCMSHGLSKPAAQCLGSTLHQAQYTIRSSSSHTASWTHSPSTPVYGTGQGSGVSPGPPTEEVRTKPHTPRFRY